MKISLGFTHSSVSNETLRIFVESLLLNLTIGYVMFSLRPAGKQLRSCTNFKENCMKALDVTLLIQVFVSMAP